MKKRCLLVIILSFITVLSAHSAVCAAAGGIESKIVRGSGGDERIMDDYVSTARWSSVIQSNVFDNGDGTFTVVDADEENETVNIAIYDSGSFQTVSTKTIDFELPLFGGFYSGEKYNYILFGQNNEEENDNKEVIRIVKYDKNFKYINAGSVYGSEAYTINPFYHTSSIAENGNELVVHTGRKRYTTEDGLNHQSQLTIVLDTDTMEVKNDLGEFQDNHVSHSFNQFVKYNEKGEHILIDHGDAYPRSVVMNEYHNGFYRESEMFEIPGPTGANCTGVTVGGFELSANKYIVAINTIDHDKASDYDSFEIYGLDKDERDIVLLIKDRHNYFSDKVDQIYLTDYVDHNKLGSTPYLVKLPNGYFLVMWEEFEYTGRYSVKDNGVKYVYVDENGNKLTDIQSAAFASLSSDCQPVLVNGKVTWYINESNSSRRFYTMTPDESVISLPEPEQHPEMIGDNVYWTLDDDGTLNITGSGEIYDFPYYNNDYWGENAGEIKKVVVEEGITRIGDCAFEGCSSLEEIILPDTITSIGADAFYGTAFMNDRSNRENGVIYIGNVLIDSSYSVPDNYSVKDGTTVIADAAFSYSYVNDIYFPESVQYIGKDAFNGCKFTHIILPPKLKYIGDSAFQDCINLTEAAIPESIKELGNEAFAGCTSLKNVELPHGLIEIGIDTFYDCWDFDIYFSGSESQWKRVGGNKITQGTVHFNSHMPITPVSAEVSYEFVDDIVSFSVTSLDDRISELYYIKLFIAKYSEDGALLDVSVCTPDSIQNDKAVFTGVLPSTNNYKIMLWDRHNMPLVKSY